MMRGICIELFQFDHLPGNGWGVMTTPENRLVAEVPTREL